MARPSRRASLIALALAALVLAVALLPRPAATPSVATLFPQGELRIGVEAALPPFVTAPDGELAGLAIDLGRALGEELGLPVRFVTLGLDSRFDALRTGQIDLLAVADARATWREPEVLATRPWFDAGLVLVSRASQPVEAMSELAGHSLALALGSPADIVARRWGRRIASFKTLAYELPAHALDALRFELADAALVDAIDARLHLRRLAWKGQLRPVSERQIALALLAEPSARWHIVDRALETLMERGVVLALLDTWL